MNAVVSRQLNMLARRINGMTLRERAIMAVSLAAALAAVIDFLVLSPQFAAQRGLVAQMRTQGQEMAVLRAQLAPPAADSPEAQARRALEARQAEVAEVEATIATRLAGRTDTAAQLPDLLQRVLRRHEHLTLLKLDTVPPTADDAAARRVVELQVAGRYADLVSYAGEIEQQLPGLQWAALAIDGAPQPPVLSARVWLPGAGS
jgi:MSHA biogenesis protein MshJ